MSRSKYVMGTLAAPSSLMCGVQYLHGLVSHLSPDISLPISSPMFLSLSRRIPDSLHNHASYSSFNIIMCWRCSVLFFPSSSLLTLTRHLRQRRPKKVSSAPISARFQSGRQRPPCTRHLTSEIPARIVADTVEYRRYSTLQHDRYDRYSAI